MKFSNLQIEIWRQMATDWLSRHYNRGPSDVSEGRTAWTIAHHSGITREAYADRSVTDGHIQTALERIFPNAKFLDKKVY